MSTDWEETISRLGLSDYGYIDFQEDGKPGNARWPHSKGDLQKIIAEMDRLAGDND